MGMCISSGKPEAPRHVLPLLGFVARQYLAVQP